jgi:hypothetical protein
VPRLRLQLTPAGRWACAVLNVVPVGGVGAILAGHLNPHTRLRRNGIVQLVLVVFGTWPLVAPGAIGWAWAIWDAVRIGQAQLLPRPAREAAA